MPALNIPNFSGNGSDYRWPCRVWILAPTERPSACNNRTPACFCKSDPLVEQSFLDQSCVSWHPRRIACWQPWYGNSFFQDEMNRTKWYRCVRFEPPSARENSLPGCHWTALQTRPDLHALTDPVAAPSRDQKTCEYGSTSTHCSAGSHAECIARTDRDCCKYHTYALLGQMFGTQYDHLICFAVRQGLSLSTEHFIHVCESYCLSIRELWQFRFGWFWGHFSCYPTPRELWQFRFRLVKIHHLCQIRCTPREHQLFALS